MYCFVAFFLVPLSHVSSDRSRQEMRRIHKRQSYKNFLFAFVGDLYDNYLCFKASLRISLQRSASPQIVHTIYMNTPNLTLYIGYTIQEHIEQATWTQLPNTLRDKLCDSLSGGERQPFGSILPFYILYITLYFVSFRPVISNFVINCITKYKHVFFIPMHT